MKGCVQLGESVEFDPFIYEMEFDPSIYEMEFDPSIYEKGVGEIYACQLSVQMLIEDETKPLKDREYAKRVYKWLGAAEHSIDELFAVLPFRTTDFILQALLVYKIETSNSNIWMHYANAVESLKYQLAVINKNNKIKTNRTLFL